MRPSESISESEHLHLIPSESIRGGGGADSELREPIVKDPYFFEL